MADNVTIDNGELTDFTAVTDEITSPYTGGSGHAQAVKLLGGAANDNTPAQVTPAGALKVDGSAVTQPVSGPLTDAQLRASAVPVNPSAETAGVGVGAAADAEAVGNGSVIAILKRIRTLLGGTLNVLAQAGDNVIGRVKITDGATVATVRDLAANDALNVAIVDASGNQITSFGGSGGTAMADDAAFTPATTQVTPMGALADETATDSVDEGDIGAPRMTLDRKLLTRIVGATDGNRLDIDASGRAKVAVETAPAASRTSDSISVALQTDAVMSGLTALTPKFKSLTIAASTTDASVVAAVASKKIRVLALAVQCGGTATTITFESDEATDVRLHKVPAGANGGQILPFNPVGWFETGVGFALIATTGAGSDTEVSLVYAEV